MHDKHMVAEAERACREGETVRSARQQEMLFLGSLFLSHLLAGHPPHPQRFAAVLTPTLLSNMVADIPETKEVGAVGTS